MLCRPFAALAVATLLLAAGCASEPLGGADHETSESSSVETSRAADAGLDCEEVSTGTVDVIPPTSVEDARAEGWPKSARGAATAIAAAPAYRARLGGAKLTDRTAVKLRGASNAVRFLAVAPNGDVVGSITVEELLPEVWAGASVATCA